MIALLRSFRETLRPVRPARRRSPSPAVEGLDRRVLPSAGLGHALAGHAAEVRGQQDSEHDGTVVKKPQFYEDYVGPKLAQLDVVEASGQLLREWELPFPRRESGRHQPERARDVCLRGRSQRPSPHRAVPRPARHPVRRDRGDQDRARQVADRRRDGPREQDDHDRARPALQISGKEVRVVVPGSLLPSTGLTPSHYRYDFWPEDGLAGSTNIASFAPEFHDIRVGVEHRF